MRLILSSAWAAIITNIFVVTITIWGELSAPLKDWLKNFSGHHWTSKSILAVLLYAVATVLFYFVLRAPNESRVQKTLFALLLSLPLGILAIALFYTGHHMGLL